MDVKKPKLYLNMILKNDEQQEMVKRSIDSVKDYVDGMFVAITYTKTEPTGKNELVKLLKEYGANVLFFKWTFSFADARQFVMDNTPHGEEIYIYWQDADDVLQNPQNLRVTLEGCYAQKIASVFFTYWYAVDLDENGDVREVVIEHKRERVIRNDGTFKWVGMLHETLIEQRIENVIKIFSNDCIVIHLSTEERTDKAIDRNIKILEEQIKKENRRDPRR